MILKWHQIFTREEDWSDNLTLLQEEIATRLQLRCLETNLHLGYALATSSSPVWGWITGWKTQWSNTMRWKRQETGQGSWVEGKSMGNRNSRDTRCPGSCQECTGWIWRRPPGMDPGGQTALQTKLQWVSREQWREDSAAVAWQVGKTLLT